MPRVPEPPEVTPGRGLTDRRDHGPRPIWRRAVFFLGIAGVSVVILYGLSFVYLSLMLREPARYEGVASRSVAGEIEPGQTVVARIDVSVDMNEIFESSERLKIELTLTDPSPRSAVLAWFGVEHVGETRPALVGETVDVATLDVPYPCVADERRCVIPVDVRLGNAGTTTERWVVTAAISRSSDTQDRADAFEVKSFKAQIAASEVARGEWVSPGTVAFDSSGELVAYSVTVDTSVNDPSLFDVVVTEPRHWLVTRSIEAVVGPSDVSWSLAYFEPSPDPLAGQARCDQDGCHLSFVAMFRPHEDDWWIPIVRPTATAPPDLLKLHSTNIEIEQVRVAEVSGLLGEQEPSGKLTLHIEGEANMTQAALAVLIYPQDQFQWAVPKLRTDEGQAPKSYRWFDLECDGRRCIRDVEVTWDLADHTERIPLEYWGVVIGGTGNGLPSPTPPMISIDE